METEYGYLLHLLGAYLREEVPAKPENVDLDKLLQLAQIHGVPGILGYMAKKYTLAGDAQQIAYFRSLCMNTIALYGKRHALARALVEQLEEAGIDHILMKGFVLRENYPVPELRSFTDIDLVIRPEDRKNSHELMLALGFETKDDWEPVYSYHRGKEYYEIHSQIMEVDVSEKADYRSYFDAAWDHVRPVSDHSFRFTPEFHFLYMLTHIAKHIHGSGAGIRLYLDAAAFLLRRGNSVDWGWVEDQLHQLELWDFARMVFTAVESWFAVEIPMEFDRCPEEVLAEFTAFTLEAGVFGHHNRDGALAKMKHESQTEPASRARLLLRLAFPKAETIQARYTYLQDKPWLLPAAWVHRLVKTRKDTQGHLETARQIIHADTREVDRLKKLMEDIGL